MALFGCFVFLMSTAALASTTRNVSNYAELVQAITDSAASGDEILLTSDIEITSAVTIDKSLTIDGAGFEMTVPQPGITDAGVINATPSTHRVFTIEGGASVTIRDATVRGGNANGGGAVRVESGTTLRLENVIISNSRSNNNGGGGIYNLGVVYLLDSRLSRNSARFGGGFDNRSGATMFIDRSTITENRSESENGGGGGQNGGTLFINNTTFSNNKSTEIGGGINNFFGTLWVSNSTFSGNVGYGNLTAGGAIGVNGGTVTLLNNLFAYNYVRSAGTVTDPQAYELSDVAKFGVSGSINSYYNIFHTDTSLHATDFNNIAYLGEADGSDNTVFSGGLLTRITNGAGEEIGSGQVFLPFLISVGDGIAGTLQTGSYSLEPANAGVRTAFAAELPGRMGYWDGVQWVSLTGAVSIADEVLVDQLGANRSPIVRGSASAVVDNVYMVTVPKTLGGTVSGGSLYGDVYPAATSVNLTALPDAGQRFVRWLEDSSEVTISTDTPYSFNVNSNIVLVPVFEPIQYNIGYNANGGTGTTANSSHTYDAASALTNNGFSREGYSFTGWSSAADGTGTAYANEATVTNLSAVDGATVTLYAQWSANTYSITYDANGGTGTTANSSHTYDTASALTSNGFSRVGYTFISWNSAANGSGTAYANGESVTNLSATDGATVTLYAQWAIENYTLTFDSAGGSAVADITQDFGTNITAPVNPTRAGFTFAGWNPALPATMPVNGSVHTAQWAANPYTLTFNAQGGSVSPSTQTVNYQQAMGTLPIPTREGFYFAGWNTAADGTGDNYTSATLYTALNNLTLYAQFFPAIVFDAPDNDAFTANQPIDIVFSGGSGDVPTIESVSLTRDGVSTTLSEAEVTDLLTQEGNTYRLNTEQTGVYELTFEDTDSGEQVVLSFTVHPFVTFANSQQAANENEEYQVQVVLSDTAVSYPVTVSLNRQGVTGAPAEVTFATSEDGLVKTFNVELEATTDGQITLADNDNLANAVIGSPSVYSLQYQAAALPFVVRATTTQDGREGNVVFTDGPAVDFAVEEPVGATRTYAWTVPSELANAFSGTGASTSLDPSSLPAGRYDIQVTVTDSSTTPARTSELTFSILVELGCPVDIDCSAIGASGIPTALNNQASKPERLPLCPGAGTRVNVCDENDANAFIEAPSTYQVRLGALAAEQSWQTGEYASALTPGTLTDDVFLPVGFEVDFEVAGLANAGESVPIALPLPSNLTIPADAVWRKYINEQWFTFVENDKNSIDSAARLSNGACPSVQSNTWQMGLTEGHGCIRLTIEDGGPNDSDGAANGVIKDPGNLAVPKAAEAETVTVTASSKAGSMGFWLLGIIAAVLWWARRRPQTTNSSTNRLWIGVGLIAALFSSQSHGDTWFDAALEAPRYLTGSIGFANSMVTKDSVDAKLTSTGVGGTSEILQQQRIAGTVGVGFRFTEHVAVELNWLELGQADIKLIDLPADTTAKELLNVMPVTGRGLSTRALLSTELAEKWHPYASLGFAPLYNEVSVTINGNTDTADRWSTAFSFGAGIAYSLNNVVDVTGDVQRFNTENGATSLWQIGVRYHLGQ